MSMQGQVKWFDQKKGFGFIVGPTGEDVFVHYSQIKGEGYRTLKECELVDYEIMQGEKGLLARSVTRLQAPTAAGLSMGSESKRPRRA